MTDLHVVPSTVRQQYMWYRQRRVNAPKKRVNPHVNPASTGCASTPIYIPLRGIIYSPGPRAGSLGVAPAMGQCHGGAHG